MNWNRDGPRLSVIIAWILKRRDFYQSPFAVLQPRQLFHRLQIWSQRRVKSWGLSRRRFPRALLSCFARWWCWDWSSKCSPPWLGWLVTAGQTLCTYYVPWHSSSPSHLLHHTSWRHRFIVLTDGDRLTRIQVMSWAPGVLCIVGSVVAQNSSHLTIKEECRPSQTAAALWAHAPYYLTFLFPAVCQCSGECRRPN